LEHGEWVVELDRPQRAPHRTGAKSDELDAARAAREALGRTHLAQPRRRGDREALRILIRTRDGAVAAKRKAMCHLHALVVTAPELLRQQLRGKTTKDLVLRCARLRTTVYQTTEHRTTIIVLRTTARRILALEAEANDLEMSIEPLVQQRAPTLLTEPGVGVITAAELLCAWSHRGRLRSESAFAALAGVAPIPASSGKVMRHRLNRGGDRQLNRALHTIVLTRMTYHAETRTYAARRAQERKTRREIRRCLKRHVARRLFKVLERLPDAPSAPMPAGPRGTRSDVRPA
jgi:transposase